MPEQEADNIRAEQETVKVKNFYPDGTRDRQNKSCTRDCGRERLWKTYVCRGGTRDLQTKRLIE
jgi:hypothetical protein